MLLAVNIYSSDVLPPICFEYEFDRWPALHPVPFIVANSLISIFTILGIFGILYRYSL